MRHIMRYSIIFIVLAAVFAIGCQTAYYTVWEKLGREKRHLLREHILNARADQKKASKEFKDVLTRIKEIYNFSGGKLEKFYNKLKDDHASCAERAKIVEKRIKTVNQTASDLFKEWENEIQKMSSETFKSRSTASLNDTKERYARLYDAMSKSSEKMKPVLKSLEDYVIYMKHNLNARAFGAIKDEVEDIESDVESLISDIGKSIKEAENFLETLENNE